MGNSMGNSMIERAMHVFSRAVALLEVDVARTDEGLRWLLRRA